MTNITMEQLKKQKLISNTEGRPFQKLTGGYSKEFGGWGRPSADNYNGCTNWQSYCSFINDLLTTIRGGKTDYCYYIYQILELLKFHYDDLQTKYCDGYWEVWLTYSNCPLKMR